MAVLSKKEIAVRIGRINASISFADIFFFFSCCFTFPVYVCIGVVNNRQQEMARQCDQEKFFHASEYCKSNALL